MLCVLFRTPDILSIVIGEWNRTDSQSLTRQTMDVEKIIMHENYNPNTLENDISLVKLNKTILLSEDVFPVCAPDPVVDYTYQKCQCSGWGTLVSG